MPWPCSQVKRLQLRTFPTSNLLNNKPHMTNWISETSSGTLSGYGPSNVNHFQHRPKWWNRTLWFTSWLWWNLMPFHLDSDQTCLKSMLLKISKQPAKHHGFMAFKTFKFDVDLFSLWDSLFADMVPWINRWLKWKFTQYAYSLGFRHVFSILWDLPLPNTIHQISTYQLCWMMEHKIAIFLL
jgi:hypothetical protein